MKLRRSSHLYFQRLTPLTHSNPPKKEKKKEEEKELLKTQ